MINSVSNIIIYLLVIGILYYLFVYVVDQFIPEPPQRMLKVAGVVVICILCILVLLDMVGGGGHVPRLVN